MGRFGVWVLRIGLLVGCAMVIGFGLWTLTQRPAAIAEARALQAEDTPAPKRRPLAQIALLDGSTDCAEACDLLLAAGAYAVFVPDTAPLADLPPDAPGRLFARPLGCHSARCTTQTPTVLSQIDLAILTQTTPASGAWTRAMTRTSLHIQREGEWQELARDTAVAFDMPGRLWPRPAWLLGAWGADTAAQVATLFDLTPRSLRLTALSADVTSNP